MSHIKGKNTSPEIMVRKALFAAGFRYRLNVKNLPGKPDIVLAKYRTVIFVNGCFWHGHLNCKYSVLPTTNVDFWRAKISGNVLRDAKETAALEDQGWRVITLWTCELKPSSRNTTMTNLMNRIISSDK